MNKFLSHPGFLWATRWLLGAIFLFAASSKVTDLVEFARSISYYDMIPLYWVPAFAALLAGVETSAGLALIAGVWRKGASVVVSLMLALFILAIFTAYVRGLSIDCGCFTADLSAEKAGDIRGHMVTRIFQDVGLLTLSLNLLYQEYRKG